MHRRKVHQICAYPRHLRFVALPNTATAPLPPCLLAPLPCCLVVCCLVACFHSIFATRSSIFSCGAQVCLLALLPRCLLSSIFAIRSSIFRLRGFVPVLSLRPVVPPSLRASVFNLLSSVFSLWLWCHHLSLLRAKTRRLCHHVPRDALFPFYKTRHLRRRRLPQVWHKHPKMAQK